MSNATERGRLGDTLMREFAQYATALAEAGFNWATAWPTDKWLPGSRLFWLHGRFLLARECANLIGHSFDDEEITQFHREHLAYVAMFPSGPPSLNGG
ncbi:hypothetical protein [Streptomyces lydicus]|uniref:hypothetical protein n=1 Tax=Streptomyces lydicus TaxID=47763 RepID=UPI001013925C|nr:hypothetical protein [Streptomyces lydicus]MCZ1012047.1 hypothetical protein [Streptomyces lydicus]